MPFRARTHNPLSDQQQLQIQRARQREERTHDRYRLMYKMAEWRDPIVGIRARRLVEEPTCRECRRMKRAVIATDVDHVIPHNGNMALFLDYENTQSLCKSHHSMKTAKENSK